jgi:alpha-N-acetylglucosamine transferase
LKKCYDEKDLIKAAQIEYVSELEKLIEKTENCNEVVKSLTKQRDELMEICKLAVFSLTIFSNCVFCCKDLEEKEEREKITEDAITLKSLIGEKMENAKAAVAKEAEKAARMEASLALNEEKCQTLTSLNEHLQQQITLVTFLMCVICADTLNLTL